MQQLCRVGTLAEWYGHPGYLMFMSLIQIDDSFTV